jgi:large subunit ribosomal protein L21e
VFTLSHGIFAGRSRHLSRHDKPSKLGISKLINRFNKGDKVIIAPHGNFANIPHPRYKGRVGTVIEARGSAYVIDIPLTKSTRRTLIVPQMYLERFNRS